MIFDILRHEETDKFQKKVDFAIHLLQSIPQDVEIELAYSGGKDSDVILELAKMAGIPFRSIYKNTTIDPTGTIKHAEEMCAEILRPKKTFFELIRKNGLPSRWNRFCCKYLKKYKVLDREIQGIRRTESTARSERYKEPEICRVYSKKESVRIYLPILEWTDEDVERFVSERGIKCHQLYYDEQGNFHVERRLGCIGCPLASRKKRKEQFLQYNKFLKLWIKNFQIYLDTHINGEQYRLCDGSAYNKIFYELFCESNDDFKNKMDCGLFPETAIDAKDFLENYFKIDLTI